MNKNNKLSIAEKSALSSPPEGLGLPSLEYRRERADIIEVFKIMNNIDQMEKDKLFYISIIYSN